MENSSRRENSDRHHRRKRDHSKDRRTHHRSNDSDYKNERNKSRHRKRSRSRSKRNRHERSVSRHRSRTPENSAEKIDGNKLIADTLSLIADNKNRNFLNDSVTSQSDERKAKRKSRWAGTINDKVYVPGIPSILPSNLNKEQQEAYLLQLNIGEISCKLRSGSWEIPENPQQRSPSPEPIYNTNGTRLNTREFRTRSKLEEQRHTMVLRLKILNPAYLPPPDYKPPTTRLNDKIMIPQDDYPETNFVGLLIGPRGNTLKRMEQETGAKIIIRGKGSVKEGKTANKNGEPLPGENEPLHAYITATTPECLKSAIEKIREVIKQGIETPEGENNLRKMQLRELAVLNGTLRDGCESRCSNCGAVDHRSWLCPDKPNLTNTILCHTCGAAGHIARDCKQVPISQQDLENPVEKVKIDEEYLALMAELGVGPVVGTQNKLKQVGKVEMNKKTAPRLNLVPPPMASVPSNPPNEMAQYSMSSVGATWDQKSYEQSQMSMPWQMTNAQEYAWPDAYNYLTPVPPPPVNNTLDFFSALSPPPPPPPGE